MGTSLGMLGFIASILTGILVNLFWVTMRLYDIRQELKGIRFELNRANNREESKP